VPGVDVGLEVLGATYLRGTSSLFKGHFLLGRLASSLRAGFDKFLGTLLGFSSSAPS
jgi:hypothetical protein